MRAFALKKTLIKNKTQMKTLKKIFAMMMTVATVAVMAACAGANGDEASFIPKNATYVMHIDVASLWQKGELANADDLQTVRSLRSSLRSESPALDEMVGAMLKDPSSCGIDFGQQVCLFTDIDVETSGAVDGHIVVSAAMRSRSNFDKFLKELEDNADLDIDLEEEDGQTLVAFDDNVMMLFNDKRIFLASNISGRDDMVAYLESLANLKPKNSMAGVKKFQKYLAERKDVNLYLDYDRVMGNTIVSQSMLQLYGADITNAMRDCAYCMAGSFEKGRITFDFKAYNLPDIGEQRFNAALLDYMPSEVLSAATFAIDIPMLMKMLASMDRENNFDFMELDEPIEVKDYTVRDLINAFGGSFAIDFYGMRDDDGIPLVAAALDVKNETLVHDLLREAGLMADANGLYDLSAILPAWLYVGHGMAVASTDPAVASRAAQGQKGNGMMAVASKAKKGNYFYIDLNKNNWPQGLMQAIGIYDDPVADLVLGLLDHFEVENVRTDEGTATLFFSNEKENSLAFILQTLDKLN